MTLEFYWHIFEKYANIKFHENPYSGRGVVPCGQTDSHEEADNFFSILRTRLKPLMRQYKFLRVDFFSSEGPRSRRYGRTAAMRLLVQPYDEDEDDYFLSFS
jgi:hypothetical protein